MTVPDRISALRAAMRRARLDAFIVPSNDPHQSEYVAEHWKAREWISGFSGSAGTVVVTRDQAGLWTDSRYFLQAESEIAGSEIILFRQGESGVPPYTDWLLEHFGPGNRIGIDGKIISGAGYGHLLEKLNRKALVLVTDQDPIAESWSDRPPLPQQPVYAHPEPYAGSSRAEKLAQIRAALVDLQADAHLVSTLDDIAWLTNLRGADVDFNPVFYAYVLVQRGAAMLFVDAPMVSEAMRTALKADHIEVLTPEALPQMLATLDGGTLLIDPENTAQALIDLIPDGCQVVHGAAPSTLLKAQKNATELAHLRQTMAKDAQALLRLYRWLEAELPSGRVTEARVAAQLQNFRAAQPNYRGESFPAIAGYGPNGAIVHYRPDPENSATLRPEGIFLLDSGGQYLDGTTDITRTVALGPVSAQARRDYTLVLKGHIALARARFPVGKSGYHLDTLARMHLWEHGQDYGHGTGHGVGFFLNVHEGPHGIRGAHRGAATTVLEPGMVISNEPGYYASSQYGIRIENLILVVPAPEHEGFLEFETLTLFPIDTALIDRSLLRDDEVAWLNDYHIRVLDTLRKKVEPEEFAWLVEKCRPLPL
ncbi:MAG: aminopeptidase P family protein [Bacteroidota bacterium]